MNDSTRRSMSLTVARTINAPARAVFAAWIDPQKYRQWGGSSRLEADARPGGHFRIETPGEHGQVHVISGEYREFVPDRRLTMTWNYEGPATENMVEMLVSVELRELAPRVTEVTVSERFGSDALRGEDAPENELSDAEAGWAMVLEDLRGYLEADGAHHRNDAT